MSRRHRQLRVRDPDIFLLLPATPLAHRHPRILRTLPVDHSIFCFRYPDLHHGLLRHIQVSLDESTGGPQPVSVSERLADRRPNPEDEYRKSELSTRLTHLHSQLSPTLRRTFQLRDVDGLSIRETAQILGVPTGTVKAQSAQGRQKLKELMRRTQAAISETAKSIIGVRKFDKLKLVRRKPRPVSSTAQV